MSQGCSGCKKSDLVYDRPTVSTDSIIDRVIYDLDLKRFADYFFSPTQSLDSLDYMIAELVTPKQGEKLEGQCNAVKEILTSPELRLEVEGFVNANYGLINCIMEKQKESEYLFGRKSLRKRTYLDYNILESYANVVENAVRIDSECGPLREIKQEGILVREDECYWNAKGLVEDMKEYEYANLGVTNDYFGSVTGVQHIKTRDEDRIKESFDWYLHKLSSWAKIIGTLSIYVAELYPKAREYTFANAMDFLVDKNSEHIKKLLNYRLSADFLLGAARFTDKLDEHSMHYTLPQFGDERGFP